MHHITDDQDCKGVLEPGPGEAEQIGKTDHHSWDRVGDQGNALDHTFQLSIHTAPRRHQRRSVRDKRSRKGGDERHDARIYIHAKQCAVREHRLYMFQSK